MSPKLMRLVTAVKTRANDRGLLQKDLAGFAGITQGTMSTALSGNGQISEEKWRIICEKLDLDYDAIIMGDEPEDVQEHEETEGLMVEAEQEDLFLLVQYLEGRLATDVKAGMDVDLEKLHRLLKTMYALKDAALRM